MRWIFLLLAASLAACTTVTVPTAPTAVAPSTLTTREALANFSTAVARVEPVAERECRARAPGQNCDFLIQIDQRPNQPVNAFQTLDRSGRPLIVFTRALIEDARNVDEIAFVLSHEAAHHIENHIPETQQRAAAGAVAFGLAAAILTGRADAGVRDAAVENAARAGAFVGARQYSKDQELEADALGAVITARAGFDPVLGAGFFDRLPDPGDRFLGSHPPNAERKAVVSQVAASL